jgi:hypothetical protein
LSEKCFDNPEVIVPASNSAVALRGASVNMEGSMTAAFKRLLQTTNEQAITGGEYAVS